MSNPKINSQPDSEEPDNSDIFLSVVVPIYNEESNLVPLHQGIVEALGSIDRRYEIVYVDDGSKDKSRPILKQIASDDDNVVVIPFIRNFGQTAAMTAGIDFARGEIIVLMDGDRQNDPRDIPRLLAKLEEGYDVCSGWRKDRKDNTIRRTFPSRVANWIISKATKVELHDYGCSLKAYRREIIKGVKLYGEMHRFIPVYTSWQGARVAEVVVNHRPRVSGESKYGLERTIKVLLDLIVIKFLEKYSQKPMYFFGGFGVSCMGLSAICFGLMVFFKYFGSKSFIETPLPLVSVLLFLMGFQSILMGVIAEVLMRTYYESQNKTPYVIDPSYKLKKE